MQHYLKIYALAVCFVSIICVAITSGFAIYNVLTLIRPALTIDPFQVQYLRSNATYTSAPEGIYAFGPRPAFPVDAQGQPDPAARFEGMSETAITAEREAKLQEVYAAHSARALQGLLREGIIILVASVLFASHWVLSRRTGNKNSDN